MSTVSDTRNPVRTPTPTASSSTESSAPAQVSQPRLLARNEVAQSPSSSSSFSDEVRPQFGRRFTPTEGSFVGNAAARNLGFEALDGRAAAAPSTAKVSANVNV